MQRKTGLGRGLDALFGPVPVEEQLKEDDILKNLKVSEIEPNRNQPRKQFDQEKIEELAASIKEYGLKQPIVVTKKEDYYSIIAGERRWRACKVAGLDKIPAILREDDEAKNSQIALIENIQREDLNPYEKALGIKNLMDTYGLSQRKLAEKIGIPNSTLANQVRILNLSPAVLELAKEGKITEAHCKVLLTVDDPERQLEIARQLIERGETVRQVVKRVNASKEISTEQTRKNQILYKKIEDSFQGFFGSKVRINPGKRRGKIVIEYTSNDDLERILNIVNR